MAKNTNINLRNKMIYSVYVRNHGASGTFQDVIDDLDRIKGLGTDIIWLMPIHPIGQLNKKGELGCPYSISDFTKVNPEYGTEEDFKILIEKAHDKNMQIMIDVVYNHTSHDSVYRSSNPEYFFRRPDGNFGNKIADWSDIIDLDYDNKDLWKLQIDALIKWVKLGVDGFRCDVAPLVPMAFWLEARSEIEKINPDVIWLAETVHPHFLEYGRNHGIKMASDCETYQAFDICYDYDTHPEFLGFLRGENTLETYLERKRAQENIYPDNYVKARFLENHDNPRAKKMIPNDLILDNWTAFSFFEKGAILIYAGQEAKDIHCPSLFEIDKVNWSGLDDQYAALIKTLSRLKKDSIFAHGRYKIHNCRKMDVILATYVHEDEVLYGIFNIGQKVGEIDLHVSDRSYLDLSPLKDGCYKDEISGSHLSIRSGKLELSDQPVIFRKSSLV